MLFLFEGFFVGFFGGSQREGCEKEVQILEETISQEKKIRTFLMETDKATKRLQRGRISQAQRKVVTGLLHDAISYMFPYTFVLERKLISLRC